MGPHEEAQLSRLFPPATSAHAAAMPAGKPEVAVPPSLDRLFAERSAEETLAPSIDLASSPWPNHNYVSHYEPRKELRARFSDGEESRLWDVGILVEETRPWPGSPRPAALPSGLVRAGAGLAGASPPPLRAEGHVAVSGPFAAGAAEKGGPDASTFLRILASRGRPVGLGAGTRGAPAAFGPVEGTREPLRFLLGDGAMAGDAPLPAFDWTGSAKKVGLAVLWLASVIVLMLVFEALFFT